MEAPDWTGLEAMLADVKGSLARIDDVHRRALRVTGTATSDDKLISVVVGPRGHLLELDIDPRVFRRPDSQALSESIVSTVRLAVEDAMRQGSALVQEGLPADMRTNGIGGPDLAGPLGKHDADLWTDGVDRDV